MDARARWHALQARLTAARAALDTGDRTKALAEITAALELDRDFLAAHALHDRILAMGSADAVSATPAVPVHPARSEPYAKFEQRARRRRVDRRVDAARAAIAQQRVKAAAAALDEVIDLDPNLPELVELTAQFDELRRAAATPHHGPRLAAAVVFAVALFGASWLEDSSPILSRQIVSAAAPVVTAALVDKRSAVAQAGPGDAALVNLALLDSPWTADAETDPATFDACDPLVDGDVATVVCRAAGGPWNVTLRKIGTGWKIETARAGR